MTHFVKLLVALSCCTPQPRDVAYTAGPLPGVGSVSFRYKADPADQARVLVEGATVDSPWVDAAAGQVDLRGLPTGKPLVLTVEIDTAKGVRQSDPLDITVAPPPQGVPPLQRRIFEPSRTCQSDGFVLFSYFGDDKSGVAVIDREGRYVWAQTSPSPELVARARVSKDGHSLLWNVADAERTDDFAAIVRQPFDGGPQTRTRTRNGHHDFVETAVGTYAWNAFRFEDVDVAGLGEVCVAGEVLYEGVEGLSEGEAPTTVWDTFDDYPRGIDALPPEEIAQPFLGNGCYEFQHANSLAYVPQTDTFVQYWRWRDTMLAIDRDGQVPWQFGGPDHSLSGTDALHQHSHFSDVWANDDGSLGALLYDNRNAEEGSRLVEFAIEGTTFREVWSHEIGRYDKVLGDVVRMPGCDNLLVSFSDQGRIVELTRAGEVVWEVAAALGNVTGRVAFVPDIYALSEVSGR